MNYLNSPVRRIRGIPEVIISRGAYFVRNSIVSLAGMVPMRPFLILPTVVFLGCSVAGLADNTVLIQFKRPPTKDDSSSVEQLGGRITLAIHVADALVVRTDKEAESYSGLAGIDRVDSLGSDEDPAVSVFITLITTATQEDVDFVIRAGGLGVNPSGGLIATVMLLSTIDNLAGWQRLVDVEIVPGRLTTTAD